MIEAASVDNKLDSEDEAQLRPFFWLRHRLALAREKKVLVYEPPGSPFGAAAEIRKMYFNPDYKYHSNDNTVNLELIKLLIIKVSFFVCKQKIVELKTKKKTRQIKTIFFSILLVIDPESNLMSTVRKMLNLTEPKT